MIFVDTTVFVYAVGRPHPLRERARSFFEVRSSGEALVTSAEVLQELMHVYLAVGRMKTLDSALRLATATATEIWSVESEDVLFARELARVKAGLAARDLVHVACCRRRGVSRIETFDRALAAAFAS
jgi:predicted nucleic acid-binding protein